MAEELPQFSFRGSGPAGRRLASNSRGTLSISGSEAVGALSSLPDDIDGRPSRPTAASGSLETWGAGSGCC